MWAKHHAWLSTSERKNEPCRAEKALSNGFLLHRPPVEDYEGAVQVVEAFLDIGCCDQSGMGDLPLSWQSIHYWKLETENQWMEPGDIEALRDMSISYVIGLDQYRDKIEPSPYITEQAQAQAKLDKSIRSVFDALVTRKPKAKGAVQKNIRVNKRP